MYKYFENLSFNINHGINTTASNIVLLVDFIRKRAKEDLILQKLDKIDEKVLQLKNRITAYSGDIVAFSEFGKHSIRKIVNGAIEMYSRKSLKESNIELEFSDGSDYEVFCSLFLKYLLYDAIKNSVFSIKKRFKENKTSKPGKIEIEIKEITLPLGKLEEELNKRCSISIWDNGIGIKRKNLEQIGKKRFTTKDSGTGLGLFALRNYVENIGGTFKVDGKEDEYFKVTIIIDKYNPIIHN